MAHSSSSSPAPAPFVKAPRPKRILIVGGGVAGLAALRALVEERGTSAEGGPFEQVELIERRDNIGGVWYLNEDVVRHEKAYPKGTASGRWPIVPERDSSNGHFNGSNHSEENGKRPFWPSPAYPALRGNVLPRFLSLAGAPPFPSSPDRLDPFPTLSETQAYLEMVAKPLRRHIRCNVECLGVRELPGRRDGENRWAVRTRDWNNDHSQGGGPSSRDQTEYFDAVVLTVGWTDRPLFPRMAGLEEAKSVGLVEHCKWYRGAEPYGQDSRILVVGNGNSGNDVAAQLASSRRPGHHPPVYRVARHKAWFFYVSLPDAMIEDVPAMESMSLSQDGQKVHVKLVNGSVLENIDRVIFASGYEIGKFPWVQVLTCQPGPEELGSAMPSVNEEDSEWDFTKAQAMESPLWKSISSPPQGTSSFDMTKNPDRVPDLYWQFLHARASTLAIINLSVTSIPFWTSDLQSHCLRAIWDGSNVDFDQQTMEQRLEYETKRIQWLVELKETEDERIRAAQARFIEEQGESKGAYVPAEHTAPPPYHVLGTIVDDYGTSMRALAVAAKPEWQGRLPSWSQHAKERNGMYDVKRTTLEKKRQNRVR